MKLAADYLKRTGYRLPTEAEVEYATRAGAVTSRCYGETDELLDKYAWYAKNAQGRSWPGGAKKPNDLGLFDMHGDVWVWCQVEYKPYPATKAEGVNEDIEGKLSIDPTEPRVLRGGAFSNQAVNLRSAGRFPSVPSDRDLGDGFRPARTFPRVP
jgi:formylglycine-generating enzyme required for sulfatase activity